MDIYTTKTRYKLIRHAIGNFENEENPISE